VEAEQAALHARQASGIKSSDIALKQFLRLLLWLRRVLLQDCAVLYSRYPSCGIFRYAPFNTPTFREFSSTSSAVILRAEEDARHALQNLPDNVVTSFRGLATDIKMDQQAQRVASDTRWDAMENRMNELSDMLGVIVGAKATKRRKGKSGKPFINGAFIIR
jgi:Centromere DNA-binding protein complex CBF3 subunit, domain 2